MVLSRALLKSATLMNYEHAYHAGSHADVFKHAVLTLLLDFLTQKDKPMTYIDLYAGNGEYDLTEQASHEFHTGINKLKNQNLTHPILQKYFLLAQNFAHYPGSPLLAKKLLRPTDELILVEKSDEAHYYLKKLFPHYKNIHIHHMDAEMAIKALLPPKIKRGLVLIDPPFESPDEFKNLPYFIKTGLERFNTGIFMVWYPIKSRAVIKNFYDKLNQLFNPEDFVILECCPYPDDVPIRLNGSGLVIFNPPWKFEEAAKKMVSELLSLLKK